MSNEIIKATGRAFASKALTKATKRIDALNDNVRSNLYEIASILSEVKETKAFSDDGYKDVAEWAKECFGYEKSMVYNLAKIGKEYVSPVLSEKGKTIGYRSNLIESGEDYTTTQVIKMLPAGRELAKELTDAELITPAMSTREIEKAIKNAINPESLEDESDVVDESENDVSENDTPDTVTITRALLDRIIDALEKYDETDLLLEIDKEIE